MRYTEASPVSQKLFVIRSLLLVVGVVFLFGCDKKGAKPDAPAKAVLLSSYGDIPPPPPVVRVPDAAGWLDPDVAVFESAGPEDAETSSDESDLRGAVKAQAVFVEVKSKKLDAVQKKAKEVERLIRAKGKKGFDSWRKRHGKKVPVMTKLQDLEKKGVVLQSLQSPKPKEDG